LPFLKCRFDARVVGPSSENLFGSIEDELTRIGTPESFRDVIDHADIASTR